MDDFAMRLRSLRMQRGINIRTISDLCGVSSSAMSRYERGSAEPTASVICAIADYYGVTTDELLGRKKY